MILLLSAVFLGGPPTWVLAAGAGAGSAVAVHAAWGLIPPSLHRAASRPRWAAYVVVAGVATVLAGPWVELVLIGCGLVELLVRRPAAPGRARGAAAVAVPPSRRSQASAAPARSAAWRGSRSRSARCRAAAAS